MTQIQDNIDLNKTGNLKFDVVGDNIHLSNFNDEYVDPILYKTRQISDNITTDFLKYFNSNDLLYQNSIGENELSLGFSEDYRYYRYVELNKKLRTSIQVDFDNQPEYLLIIKNTSIKYRSSQETIIPANFKQSQIIYSLPLQPFFTYLEELYSSQVRENINYESKDDNFVNIYGINPAKGKYESKTVSKKIQAVEDEVTGDWSTNKIYTDDNYYTDVLKNKLITPNVFNFDIYFSDDTDFEDYQVVLVKLDEISRVDINWTKFNQRYGTDFSTYNLENTSNIDIGHQITLDVNYEDEPILNQDYNYVVDDRFDNLITVKEKFFNSLILNTDEFTFNQLFGMDDINNSEILGEKTQKFIPSNLVWTLKNKNQPSFKNGDWISISPGQVGNNIEYRIIAREDLDYKVYPTYKQNNPKLKFQSTNFTLTDITSRLDSNKVNANKVNYVLEVQIDEWVDLNESENIRVYFGKIDKTMEVHNIRKDIVNDRTTFELYDYGTANFNMIDEDDYGILKFEYQEKPYTYTYFNSKGTPSEIIESMATAFNRFNNIVIEAVSSDNNLIIKSIYADNSWGKIYLDYYLGPNSALDDFEVNGITLSGINIVDGHDTSLFTVKKNRIYFTPYIKYDKIIYKVDVTDTDTLTETTLIQTKLGRGNVLYTLVDGTLAFPKDEGNLSKAIITIENDNDECKQNHSNYIGVTNKFIPKIWKIIQLGI